MRGMGEIVQFKSTADFPEHKSSHHQQLRTNQVNSAIIIALILLKINIINISQINTCLLPKYDDIRV